MSNQFIANLPQISSIVSTHEFPVNEAGTATKKVTVAQTKTYLESVGKPRVFSLGSSHTLASTTGTAVSFGTVTLEAGKYAYTYYLIHQSAGTGVGIRLGINFTGTAATRTMMFSYPSTGTLASTGIADDVGATSGQTYEAMAHTAFSTAAPNMGHAGVATAGANIPAFINGVLAVTVQGNLELWHACSAATNTSVMAGSSLYVIRCA